VDDVEDVVEVVDVVLPFFVVLLVVDEVLTSSIVDGVSAAFVEDGFTPALDVEVVEATSAFVEDGVTPLTGAGTVQSTPDHPLTQRQLAFSQNCCTVEGTVKVISVMLQVCATTTDARNNAQRA